MFYFCSSYLCILGFLVQQSNKKPKHLTTNQQNHKNMLDVSEISHFLLDEVPKCWTVNIFITYIKKHNSPTFQLLVQHRPTF